MKLIEFSQQKEIPDHLKQKSGLASQIVFTAFFAVLFINIYKPFTSAKWADLQALDYFVWSCGVVLIGFVVLTLSRVLLYFYAKRHRLFYWVYVLWIFAEISVMAIVYTLIAWFFMPATVQISDGNEIVAFFWTTFFTIFFVLLIPTVLTYLYLAFVKKKKDLQELQNQVSENAVNASLESPSVLQFKDEKGDVKLQVKSENVIWMEAADNYVTIKYKNQEKLSSFLLRNSLKHLAEDFKDTTLCRCHRSYMVNFDHVVALRKSPDGLIIDLDVQPPKEIPVSKTYREETSQAFIRYNSSEH